MCFELNGNPKIEGEEVRDLLVLKVEYAPRTGNHFFFFPFMNLPTENCAIGKYSHFLVFPCEIITNLLLPSRPLLFSRCT